MKRLTMIVAAARNGTIGRENGLPWRLSGDLKRFRQATMGKAIILGRKTMESIGKPLPGRHSIVLSRQEDFTIPGVHVARSVTEARDLAENLGDSDAASVIGGEAVYRAFFPITDEILLTLVDTICPGDARFPFELLSPHGFSVAGFEEYPAGERDEFRCTVYRLIEASVPEPITWRGLVRPTPESTEAQS